MPHTWEFLEDLRVSAVWRQLTYTAVLSTLFSDWLTRIGLQNENIKKINLYVLLLPSVVVD